ncbi:hypothetical protein BT63DRAFT_413696 [Microthyrium microscopicum]|uniref:DUF803-domain-containing protein n=1 Tax=Microthyrium microscopicum TaxID=703497 RepID=A0A6A6UCZ8_9PEZI|nr:hypothetical protein BT63DRAFT_413696 [Microthyrium microscopicum]
MGSLPTGGGTVASVGLTLQRKSHLLEEQKEENEYDYERRPPYKRRRWQETFTYFSVVGTLLVATGAVLIALFGAMSEPSHNLDQLLFLLGQKQFLIWVVGTFFVVGAILVAIILQERLGHRLTHRARLMLGLAYGSLSGILSAHCLLLAKSAVELLVRTIVDRNNQFNRWQSWMILVGLVFLAIAQLYYLHRGLKLCSTSVLYPFVFCVYNIIAILDGLIYFRQASRISPLHAGLIALGTVILLGGVFALSWRLDPEYQSQAPASDSKAAARVGTTHSALVPGMGLVETEEPFEDESAFIRPGDQDDTVSHAKHLHYNPNSASESTPLLRTQTAPMWRMAKTPRKEQSFRPPRVRRLTVPEETTDLWDDLNNDSNETRRFSGAFSPQMQRSPSATRLMRRHKRTSTPTLSQRGRSSSNLFGTFGSNIRWPTWDKGKQRRVADDDDAPPIESGDETDEAEGDGTVRRHRPWRSSGQSRRRSEGNGQHGADSGWLKLKWWKRPWRPFTPEEQEGGDSQV